MRLGTYSAFVFLIASLIAPAVHGQMPPATVKDLAYGGHPLETMDVYLAPGGGLKPVLIEIHPGGWASGGKSQFSVYGGLIEKIFSRGISVISIGYPLAPTDLFPKANLSCQRAVQFVRMNAAAWQIDAGKISLLGMSAGAHLSLWVAMAADAQHPASTDPVKTFSSRVRAVIAYRGPSDLTDSYYKYDTSIGHGTTGSPVWQFLGVSTQPQWDAVPKPTKDFLSPRWLVKNGAGAAANREVAFLGIFQGNSAITSSSQLAKPNGDVHALIQGMIFLEEMRSIDAREAAIWIGPKDLDAGGHSIAASYATDWLVSQLQGWEARSLGNGTPGCFSTQALCALSSPTLGNASFAVASYNAWPGSLGAIVFTDQWAPAAYDPFGVGLKVLLLADWIHPPLVDAIANAEQKSVGLLPIPNDPALAGRTFYLQALHNWNGAVISGGCAPSPFLLSSSSGLAVTIGP